MGMMINEEIIIYRFINEFPFQEKKKNYQELEISLTGIFAVVCLMIQIRYARFLYRVIPSENTIYKEVEDIDKSTIDKLKEFAFVFTQLEEATPLNFSRIKYLFDSFFFSLTKKGRLDYLYADHYLLTVDEAGKELNVSRPTINKYGKSGQLEILDTSKHNKIPVHSVQVWKDKELLTKIHTLHELYCKRNDPLYQQLEDILARIKEFEDMYDHEPFEVVFKDVLSGNIHWDEVDSVGDYSEWELLIEERDEMKGKLGIQL